MIRNHSIYTKLIVLFVVTFFLVCVLFIILLKIEGNAYNKEESFKQENLIKTLLGEYEQNTSLDFGAYLNNSGFTSIKNPNLAKSIRTQGQTIFRGGSEFCVLSSITYYNNLYFDIQCKNFNGLFEQHGSDRVYNLLIIGFFFFSFLVMFMYFSVLKSLEPLKRLRKQIEQVANGEKISFSNYYKDDEIGQIALEFEKAFKKNQELIESRQLFLRTIMHELKTPIGKGRIIGEMVREIKQRERLIDLFEHMDSLIVEFAKIENLFSKNYNLHIQANKFSTILSEAKKYLMRDDFEKIVKVNLHHDPFINVDVEIFSLILKNMLDNALKYSEDGTCELECCKEAFVIKNTGKALSEPIEHYFKAFTREKYSHVKGMGLGLYIVYEVCKLHNFKLIYDYKDLKHCFKVLFKEKNNNEI